MKSKYIIKIIIVIFLSSLWIRCSNSDDETQVNKFAPVSNLTATPGDKLIVLSWNNPKIADLSHVLVSYEEKGEVRSERVTPNNAETSRISISAFDMIVYKFVVETVDQTGTKSDPVVVKGKTIYESNAIEYDAILSTVEIMPVGGIKVLWKNDKNLEANIVVSYDVNGAAKETVFKANSLIKEGIIEDLPIGSDIEFVVKVADEIGDSSVSKTFRVAPQKGVKLDKKGWTITTNSEIASTGPGAAINLIDGDPSTYWQSVKATSSATFYCEVVVDLKEMKSIAGISLERKFGDSTNSSWDNNVALSKDGVTWDVEYKYANTMTDPIFKVEFDRGNDGEQYYRLPQHHEARYVRLASVRASAAGLIALFGELNIYGY